MPKSNIIPMRPGGFNSSLTQGEQTCLTWLVLSGCSKEDAFILFARPDMADSKAKPVVKETIKQFFARAEVKEYLMAYRTTLEDLVNPKRKEKEPVSAGTLEERKARAKTKLVEFAMSLADNIEQADDPEFVLKMADKCNLLDGDEEVEEQPRRYLPVSPCQSGCAYRLFCEENTEDMCQYCRYHKFGEDNGIHYDKTEILDVPQRSGTELAEENPTE